MHSAILQFRLNIERVRNLGGLYLTFSRLTTPVIDTTDILRTQIVLSVSAMDQYIHELTRLGMTDIFNGSRLPTNAFRRFQVSIGSVMLGLTSNKEHSWFEEEIREKHGYLAFQRPDKIADAIRLFSACELWPSIASRFGLSVQDVKNRLQLIVDRRDKISHEADLDPSYPGIRWPISYNDAENTVKFIEDLCEEIHSLVCPMSPLGLD